MPNTKSPALSYLTNEIVQSFFLVFSRSFECLKQKGFGTPVLVRRVPDYSIEQPNLTEKDGDEKGSTRGVGGGGEEEGDPRGHREHGGGQVVHPHVLRVQVRQCHL